MIGYLLLLLFAFGPVFSQAKNPLVKTDIGDIVGNTAHSRKGFLYYSFRGIKYAEAPTGELRFKPPVRVKPSEGRIDATADGPPCYQPGWDGESEDCLWVNVFTRYTVDNMDKLLPVLVFFHGGAFVIGSALSAIQGPDYLLDQEIVVVVVNYRLGTFGFLSTGDEHAPGNYGMKDQVEALRWVQRNIEYFGGDPNRVTIAGQSAGGASVGLHLLSPMSRGLFHGAILTSGSAYNNWAVDKNPKKLAEKQAALLNCPTNSSEDIVNCIKNVPANDIAEMYNSLQVWNGYPLVTLSPVIEVEDHGEERFLTKHPLQSFAEGDVADVPVIIGTTHDEFASLATPIVQNEKPAAELSANWNELAPVIFLYDRDDDISAQLREYYLGSVDEPITRDSYDGLSKLFADSSIIAGVIGSTKVLADTITSPVYLYQFNYRGNNTGVGHTDDMYYLWHTSGNTMLDTESEDGQFSNKLTKLYKNFIETGNPTPEPDETLNSVTWIPYKNEDPGYLDLNKTLTLEKGLYYGDRMSFWESLFPLPIFRRSGMTRSGMTRSGGSKGRGSGSGNTRFWWWMFG